MFSRNKTLYVRASKNSRANTGSRPMGPLVMLLAIVGACLGILVAKVYMEHQAFKLSTQWQRVDRELDQVISEQDNLRAEKEHYTQGQYILARAREMGLQPALPGQVRRMWQPVTEELDRRQSATEIEYSRVP